MTNSIEIVKDHLNKALSEYSQGVHYETLLEAKKVYFETTGVTNEDDDDFEARMNAFNEWYLLQYQSSNSTRTVIKDYIMNNPVDEEAKHALLNVNFSFFEYLGKNFKKQIVLKDLIHNQKVNLIKEHVDLALLKNDSFVGRVLMSGSKCFLLNGLCVLPREVNSVVKKEAKHIRKLDDKKEEENFLLRLEFLKNKWQRYCHIDPVRIFQFNDAS